MFGNLGDISSLMKKAMDMQKNLKSMQDEMAKYEAIGKSKDGKVEVLAGGDFKIKKIIINPSIAGETEIITELVTEAVNEALDKVRTKAREELSTATGGLNLPNIF
ncbi:MAG: nucleoid-associated protein, YbaB/EbfC family [Lentisphaerae bacterium GWF2_52_8]|nr:MAG: nucleoid-associated protein, YbaB/EbfC family [Lentisphaerae bacterium GWF2_52_8]